MSDYGTTSGTPSGGCALAAVIPIAALLLIVLLALMAVVAMRPAEAPVPPVSAPLLAAGGLSIGAGLALLGAAIILGAIIVAAAILFCCCCCRKGSNAGALVDAALKLIAVAMGLLGDTIKMLATLIDQLKNLPLPAPPGGGSDPVTTAVSTGTGLLQKAGDALSAASQHLPKPPFSPP